MESFVETKLNGYVRPNFQKEGPIFEYFNPDGEQNPELQAKVDDFKDDPQDMKIYNARELQAAHQGSKAEFFREHGFVLLDSKTEVTDWSTDYTRTDSEITTKYQAEIENHLRHDLELDEQLHSYMPNNFVLCRGEGQQVPYAVFGIHQDYGLTADCY